MELIVNKLELATFAKDRMLTILGESIKSVEFYKSASDGNQEISIMENINGYGVDNGELTIMVVLSGINDVSTCDVCRLYSTDKSAVTLNEVGEISMEDFDVGGAYNSLIELKIKMGDVD